MTARYLQTLFTDGVKAAQEANGSRAAYARFDAAPAAPDTLTGREAAFIASRDSFYIASVAENGWPYLQHRGGPRGFVKILDERRLGFADYRGNRQYMSVGNVTKDPRVSLFFMDYPSRARLKLLGRMRSISGAAAQELAEPLTDAVYGAKVERFMLIEVEAFDWNCPQHITPRYTMDEIEPMLATLKQRIAELEAQPLNDAAPHIQERKSQT